MKIWQRQRRRIEDEKKMKVHLPSLSNISVTCQMNSQSNLPFKNIYIKQKGGGGEVNFNQTLLKRPHCDTTFIYRSPSFTISFFSSKYHKNKTNQHSNSHSADPIEVQTIIYTGTSFLLRIIYCYSFR